MRRAAIEFLFFVALAVGALVGLWLFLLACAGVFALVGGVPG